MHLRNYLQSETMNICLWCQTYIPEPSRKLEVLREQKLLYLYSLRLCGSFYFALLNLPCNFKRQVERVFGGFAADFGRLLRLHAFDEMLQFEFQRFVFFNRHW